jgi:hypothetical protein
MTKPKNPAPEAPEPVIPQEPQDEIPVEAPECRYIAFCTDDGVCPYSIKELMKKVRLQAIKDILELIKMEQGECSTIQLDDNAK